MSSALNIYFFGHKPIAEEAFRILLQDDRGVLRVRTACSNAPTRQTWWGSCGVFDLCQERGIQFFDNADSRAGYDVAIESPSLLLSVQHCHIFKRDFLERFDHKINVHLAPIPEYRGCHGYNHAILNGDKSYAVSVHEMTAAIDTGRLLIRRDFPIAPDETAASLYEKSVCQALAAFAVLVQQLPVFNFSAAPNPKDGKYYGRQGLPSRDLTPHMGDAAALDRHYRALFFPPFETPHVLIEGKKVVLNPERIAAYARSGQVKDLQG